MKAISMLVTVVASGLALAQAPRVGKQDQTATPKPGDQTIQNFNKPIDPSVGLPGVNPNSYLIGGEDVIGIKVWRQPEFSFNTAVRPDGKITIPLSGELMAAGKTPSQLEKEIAKGLANFINSPEVTVTVIQVLSKKYYIIGEVMRAGSFALASPITVLEALSQCGFAPFANKKKIRILRGTQTFMFNFEEVIKGKRMEQNIGLENGDYVIVK